MTRDEIKKLALHFGFTLREQKDGTQDLNDYVYKFATACFVRGETSGIKHATERIKTVLWMMDEQ